jgi:prepilin-type N-terminal cleavage/methylation domain-containing protein
LSRAFTLIELLVVIAIMAILAGLIFPVTSAVNKAKIRTRTRAEMGQIIIGIETYKSKLGHYPPDNPLYPAQNQLYYELLGTTNDPSGNFATLDGRPPQLTSAQIKAVFGVDGFVNTLRGGGGDEARSAVGSVLAGLKPTQSLLVAATPPVPPIMVLGVPLDGWPPLGEPPPGTHKITPWSYNSSSPTNNPRSFDLWIDLIIGGKTNRICNWSERVITL